MRGKICFAAILVTGGVLGCSGPDVVSGARPTPTSATALRGSARRGSASLGSAPSKIVPEPALVKEVAGLRVRLVAVMDTGFMGRGRLADHAWTPGGHPYEGPESRLAPQGIASAPAGGTRRSFAFELEPPAEKAPVAELHGPAKPRTTSSIDVFAYLPKGELVKDDRLPNPAVMGPLKVLIWHGIPRDSSGKAVLPVPSSVGVDLGALSADPQPVVLGIAQGEYKTIAKGPASVAGLAENQTSIIASGPWGRIEATHLPTPMVITAPSETHRFRLLGGAFPTKSERQVFFYDSDGKLIARCGDGPNNPGHMRPPYSSVINPLSIARFEVQERPYELVQFDGISFRAPRFAAHSGPQGREHAVESSIGKVLGVLKPTKDGAWSGYVLYAADGTRWLDPGSDALGTELAGLEYGMFNPWNQPLDDRRSILFEPNGAFSAPTLCEIYAADSPDGPKEERLTSWDELPFRSPVTTIPCGRTTRPYMRLEVRAGGETWRTLETIAVTKRMYQAAEEGQPGTRVLEVFLHADGRIRIWADEAHPVSSTSKWQPGAQRIRVVARRLNGKTVDVNFNMSGFGGLPPHEDHYRGLEYTRQTNGTFVQSGAENIDMKDIEAFEIQVLDMKPVVSIPLHSPVE